MFPLRELCGNWVRAVMTGVNDIDCQCLLNELMVQRGGITGLKVSVKRFSKSS